MQTESDFELLSAMIDKYSEIYYWGSFKYDASDLNPFEYMMSVVENKLKIKKFPESFVWFMSRYKSIDVSAYEIDSYESMVVQTLNESGLVKIDKLPYKIPDGLFRISDIDGDVLILLDPVNDRVFDWDIIADDMFLNDKEHPTFFDFLVNGVIFTLELNDCFDEADYIRNIFWNDNFFVDLSDCFEFYSNSCRLNWPTGSIRLSDPFENMCSIIVHILKLKTFPKYFKWFMQRHVEIIVNDLELYDFEKAVLVNLNYTHRVSLEDQDPKYHYPFKLRSDLFEIGKYKDFILAIDLKNDLVYLVDENTNEYKLFNDLHSSFFDFMVLFLSSELKKNGHDEEAIKIEQRFLSED